MKRGGGGVRSGTDRMERALWIALVVVLGGCSSNPEPQEPLTTPAELTLEPVETDVEKAFARGLAALKLANYPTAIDELSFVARRCGNSPIGGRALLTLIAIELDPRNPAGDPELARGFARRYLELSDKPAWTEPAIETLYLVALDMGASADGAPPPEEPDESEADDPVVTIADSLPDEPRPVLVPEPLAGCEPGNSELTVGSLRLPNLPNEPVVDRLAAAEQDRIGLQNRVTRLEQELALLRQEIARIRATLKP